LIREPGPPGMTLNRAREYLQSRLLLAMQDAGAMIPLAFQGGTAVRFLFDLPRFSEDLDFALERPDRGSFSIEALEKRAVANLEREGYEVLTKLRPGHAVQSLTVGFPGLLFELGLSPHRSQRLRIRIEVDTRPPAGAELETTIVRKHTMLNLQHHDRASLLAGKLHAILQRKWAKGRDLFDLFWYMSDPRWPEPNMVLLNNALGQTGWAGPALDAASWRPAVQERIESIAWPAAERDVAPFLAPDPAADLFGKESLLNVLMRPRR
jgi:hypothetical protein